MDRQAVISGLDKRLLIMAARFGYERAPAFPETIRWDQVWWFVRKGTNFELEALSFTLVFEDDVATLSGRYVASGWPAIALQQGLANRVVARRIFQYLTDALDKDPQRVLPQNIEVDPLRLDELFMHIESEVAEAERSVYDDLWASWLKFEAEAARDHRGRS